jgi:predicted transposase YdaD
MPLLDDLRDHPVLGREFQRGWEQGWEEGWERGRREGARALLLLQTEKRFGRVPAALREHLANMSFCELEDVALRLLDARSVEELLN